MTIFRLPTLFAAIGVCTATLSFAQAPTFPLPHNMPGKYQLSDWGWVWAGKILHKDGQKIEGAPSAPQAPREFCAKSPADLQKAGVNTDLANPRKECKVTEAMKSTADTTTMAVSCAPPAPHQPQRIKTEIRYDAAAKTWFLTQAATHGENAAAPDFAKDSQTKKLVRLGDC